MSTKVVLLGHASVGKSCLVIRLIKDVFYDDVLETVGAAFAFYRTPDANFDIWDTAGQERYAPISRLYYHGAHIIILVFDVTSPISWKRVNDLIFEVKQMNPSGNLIIVGNKIDLLSTMPFEKWVHPLINELETDIIYVSAKEGTNMDFLKKRLYHYKQAPTISTEVIDLDQVTSNKCC